MWAWTAIGGPRVSDRRVPLVVRWGLWSGTRYLGRGRALLAGAFGSFVVLGLLLLIGYPLARFPAGLDSDLTEQPVQPWLWQAGFVLCIAGVGGVVVVTATARRRNTKENDPGYSTRTQRIIGLMCIVAGCAAAGLIVLGAGESGRLGVALMPVVAALVVGVVAITRM